MHATSFASVAGHYLYELAETLLDPARDLPDTVSPLAPGPGDMNFLTRAHSGRCGRCRIWLVAFPARELLDIVAPPPAVQASQGDGSGPGDPAGMWVGWRRGGGEPVDFAM